MFHTLSHYTPRVRYAKPVLLGLIVIAALVALRFFPVGSWLTCFQLYVENAGPIRFVPAYAAPRIGILLGTIAFVYFGAAAANDDTKNRTKLTYTIAGLVIDITVSFFVARVAHNALKRAGVVDPP